MQAVIDDEDLCNRFYQHCVRKSCEENLLFCLSVKEWQKCEEIERKERGLAVYQKFVAPGATQPVNLDSGVVKAIQMSLNKEVVELTVFSNAQESVMLLLQLDILPTFSAKNYGGFLGGYELTTPWRRIDKES